MAGTNLGTAYVSIMPSAKGISGSISRVLDGESKSAGRSAGLNIVGAIKGVIAGAAIGKFFKDALDAGGNLQQSFGGLDTIYGKAADGMKDLAYEAAKAGISANSYAEQAVSFGASLKQAYGSDLTAAANAANTAILDMADNSAKMGTDISSIQNAYQGFAKQNYTMLDNLKLGYGGTKKEMERLLDDAEKLTGVKYDINNLGDVYAAIHSVQQELGITGVAAAEAEGTFTGSMQSMKAAWENLKADMALGKDITQDLEIVAVSAKNFLTNNLLPMIGNVLKALPSFIGGWLQNALSNIPGMVESATAFINNLSENIKNNSGELFNGIKEIAVAVLNMFKNTDWFGLGGAVINLIWTGIQNIAPVIWNGLKQIGETAWNWFKNIDWPGVGRTVITFIGDAIGSVGRLIWDGLAKIGETAKEYFKNVDWAEAGANAFHALVDGLQNVGSALWEAITTIGETAGAHFKDIDWAQAGKDAITGICNGLTALGSFIWEGLSTIGSKATEFFQNVDWENAGANAVKTIGNGLKTVGSTIWEALKTIGTTAKNWFEGIDWKQTGINIINFIISGLKSIGSFLWGALKEIGSSALGAITSINWVQQGIDIINGIISGIKQFGSQIGETILGFASDALAKVKNFFKIGSPSKLMADSIGKWIPLGIAEGIKEESRAVSDAINAIATDATVSINPIIGNVNKQATGTPASINMTFNVYDVDNPEEFARMAMQQLELEMRIA